MNVCRFPPTKRIVARCDKLVTIVLCSICVLNMVVESVPSQPLVQNISLELWISIENQFYEAEMKIFKESAFHRPVNLFTVRLCPIVIKWGYPKNRELDFRTMLRRAFPTSGDYNFS